MNCAWSLLLNCRSAFCFLTVTLLVSSCLASEAQEADRRTVDVTARAFLSNVWSKEQQESGVVVKLDGRWLVSGPSVRLSQLGKKDCFGTDDRDFSTDLTKISRVAVNVRILVEGDQLTIVPVGDLPMKEIGKTNLVDCRTGSVLDTKSADLTDIVVSEVKKERYFRSFSITASSGNPFYKFKAGGVEISPQPKIDFKLNFLYNTISKELIIQGERGDFPSFEAYFKVDEQSVCVIDQWHPARTSSPLALIDAGLGLNMKSFSKNISLSRKSKPPC